MCPLNPQKTTKTSKDCTFLPRWMATLCVGEVTFSVQLYPYLHPFGVLATCCEPQRSKAGGNKTCGIKVRLFFFFSFFLRRPFTFQSSCRKVWAALPLNAGQVTVGSTDAAIWLSLYPGMFFIVNFFFSKFEFDPRVLAQRWARCFVLCFPLAQTAVMTVLFEGEESKRASSYWNNWRHFSDLYLCTSTQKHCHWEPHAHSFSNGAYDVFPTTKQCRMLICSERNSSKSFTKNCPL